MAQYEISVVIDDIIDALADFIDPFVDGAEIIRGQVNRTPPPSGQYIELTEILSVDLSVPYQQYSASAQVDPVLDQADLIGRVRSDIQVDFYGDNSGNWCRVILNAIRTGYGFDAFPENIKPLYATDGMQHPWTTGEKQSVTRWTITVSIQYNPQVTVPQEFADEITANVAVPVDQT